MITITDWGSDFSDYEALHEALAGLEGEKEQDG